MKYKIVTDASVDIDEEIVKKYDISILPIEVNFDGELFPEGLPHDEFYAKLKSTNIIPKTCQPNQFKFETALTPYCNKADWFVITVVISSNLAGTISQANNAVEALKMKNVYICDSQLTTFAQGALITALLKYIDDGDRTPEEVINEVERLKGKIKLYAAIDDLKFLKHGGRINAAQAVIGTVLGVKPIVTIENGKVANCAKKRGEQVNLFMLEKAQERDKNYPIYFGYTDDKSKAQKFVEKYADKLEVDPNNIEYHGIGCVVGTHVGPGVYGIVYFEK